MKISHGKQHIEEKFEDISRLVGFKSVFRFETRQTIYEALILPYFGYSCCVWGYIGIGLTEKLQNRAARIVSLSYYETRSKDLLDDLGWEVLVS